MRTCARLPAVLPSKSYIDRTPPQNGQPSTAPGQQAPQPAPAEAPSLPTYSRPFLSLSILLLEIMQNPEGGFTTSKGNSVSPKEATEKLDRMAASLGEMIDNEDELIKGTLKSLGQIKKS